MEQIRFFSVDYYLKGFVSVYVRWSVGYVMVFLVGTCVSMLCMWHGKYVHMSVYVLVLLGCACVNYGCARGVFVNVCVLFSIFCDGFVCMDVT